VPEQFGRYRLDQKIGEGGNGEVWKAHDTQTQRTVALKRLQPELASNAGFRIRFRRESAIAAGLNHHHVIPIHGFGEIDGQLYIDMRWVEGHDLATMLKSRGPLSPERAVGIIEQIASALDTAHAAGLVHRDVKPSNVLIADRDFVYLIDFGISRYVDGTEPTITDAKWLVGTAAYIAPERFNRGVRDRPLVDVYSLACLLYECLTGEKAYPAGNMPGERRHLPPPRPSKIQPDVPEAFNGVVGRGLATEPDSRYSSAGDLAAAARKALTAAQAAGGRPKAAAGSGSRPDESAPRTSPPTREYTSAATPPPPQDRSVSTSRSWKPMAILAVAAAAAGALIWWNSGDGEPGIRIGGAPTAVGIAPNGTSAYVVDGGSNTVGVVDLVTQQVTATIPVGNSPRAIAVTRDGKRAYVANQGSNSVSVIDLDEEEVLATIAVGSGPTAVAVTANGSRAYVANSDSADISVIDAAQTAVAKTIEVSDLPGDWVNGIAVTPDGAVVLVSVTGRISDDRVDVLNVETEQIVADIGVGEDPRGLAISADGRRAYVANNADSTVSVLDVANGSVTTNVPVGEDPLTITLSPNERRAYVTNASDGTFSTIDTATNHATSQTPAGSQPVGMAISPDGGRAYVADAGSGLIKPVDLAAP
jgi:serine/threonine-protein kinase